MIEFIAQCFKSQMDMKDAFPNINIIELKAL